MTQLLSLAGDFNTIQQPNDGQRQQENAVAVAQYAIIKYAACQQTYD